MVGIGNRMNEMERRSIISDVYTWYVYLHQLETASDWDINGGGVWSVMHCWLEKISVFLGVCEGMVPYLPTDNGVLGSIESDKTTCWLLLFWAVLC